MMGPWLVLGSCLLGTTCVFYEGAPDYPGADRLWQMVEKHRIGVLGVSPRLKVVWAEKSPVIEKYAAFNKMPGMN